MSDADTDRSSSIDTDDDGTTQFGQLVTPEEASDEYHVPVTESQGRYKIYHGDENKNEGGDDEDENPPVTYLSRLNAAVNYDPRAVFGSYENAEDLVVHHDINPWADAPQWIGLLSDSYHRRFHARQGGWEFGIHRGIPVRVLDVRDEYEVPDPFEAEVDYSQFRRSPRADSPIHETEATGDD